MVEAYTMRILLTLGELPAVIAWSENVGSDEDSLCQYQCEPRALALVRVSLARRDSRRAATRLEQLHANAEASGRIGSLAEVIMLEGRLA
jgi:hypothetical protein